MEADGESGADASLCQESRFGNRLYQPDADTSNNFLGYP
jgi:hypothetical protein